MIAVNADDTRPEILIVEDDELIASTLERLLELEGYRVRHAANGRAALDLLGSGAPRPAVILLDLMMPVMNGWDFLVALKGNVTSALSTTPVIVMSAAGGPARVTAQVAESFVAKPLNVDRLLQEIGRLRSKAA